MNPPGAGGHGASEAVVEGELVAFTFRADDGAFAVARIRPERAHEIVAVGALGHVQEGQHLTLHGRWVEHPSFGRQLKVSRFLVEDPRTLRGLRRYLGSGSVKGLGPTFARRVVEHFGHDTLRVIEEEPQRLREVPGIGKKRVATIVANWERDRANRELQAMLRGYGVGQALTARVVDRYGQEALSVVTREPWRLARDLRGVGFRTADAIARDQGMPLDDPGRAEAAAVHLLREAEGQGHCFLPAGSSSGAPRPSMCPGRPPPPPSAASPSPGSCTATRPATPRTPPSTSGSSPGRSTASRPGCWPWLGPCRRHHPRPSRPRRRRSASP